MPKNRLARQADGQPQGRHIVGFKGTKVDGSNCMCGGCHPNARANRGKPKVLAYGNAKTT